MKTYRVVMLIVLSCGMLILLFIFSEKEKDERMIQLQEEEYILKKRIKELTYIKREPIKLQNTIYYNDSSFTSFEARIEYDNVLVFFIPLNYCNECIENEYNRLRKLPADIQNRIIVLTNFTTIRDLKVFLSSRIIDYPIYNYDIQLFDELNNLKDPILFVLDSSLLPQNLFIPISFISDLTGEYLNYISTDVFKIKQRQNIKCVNVSTEKMQYNFGKLNLGEQVETNFELTNISDSLFIISDVESNCGCTVASWTRNPVQSGEKGIIKVEFQALDRGFFSKRISVFSNAENSPHIFTVSGEVE